MQTEKKTLKHFFSCELLQKWQWRDAFKMQTRTAYRVLSVFESLANSVGNSLFPAVDCSTSHRPIRGNDTCSKHKVWSERDGSITEWDKGNTAKRGSHSSADREREENQRDTQTQLTKGEMCFNRCLVIHDLSRRQLSSEQSSTALFCTCVLLLCLALASISHNSWSINSISEDAELFILLARPACTLGCLLGFESFIQFSLLSAHRAATHKHTWGWQLSSMNKWQLQRRGVNFS